MVGYFTTDSGNQFYIEAKRICEPENNLDVFDIIELKINDIEINFDQLSDINKKMIYNKLARC
jgi:hypothetical protein